MFIYLQCNVGKLLTIILFMQADFTESSDLTVTNSGLRERITQRLTHIWREKGVDSIFQSIFLESLKESSISQFSQIANEQAQLTKGRQSFAFSLEELIELRTQALKRVRQSLQELQREEAKTERDIEIVCMSLKELREANLRTAELLLDIDKYFNDVLREKTYSPTLARELNRLNDDNDFLRKSLLRKFILFSKGYDPLLLKHEEALRTTQNPRLKEIRCVQTLFTLPISYLYRLEKTQKGCIDYLSRGSPLATFPIKDRLKNFRIISPVRQSLKASKKYKYFSSPKDEPLQQIQMASAKLDDELNSFKLDKQIYLTNRNHLEVSRDFENMRKGSEDSSIGSPSPSTRIRNISVHSSKEHKILPRLNTIHSLNSYKDSSTMIKQSSSLTKRYNAHQSINQMEEREQELKRLVKPKKFDKLQVKDIAMPRQESTRRNNQENPPLPDSPTRREQTTLQTKKYPPLQKKKEISIKCQPQATMMRSSSPKSKEQSIQTITQPIRRPSADRLRTVQSESKRGKYKKYQLKASKVPLQIFFKNFKELQFNQNYTRILQVGSWQNSIRHNQYYFHKFFINQQLSAVSLSCGLPQGDILIKCWGPLKNCDSQMSNFLFSKYIQHIQKNTLCNTIFYNNLPIDQLAQNGFQRKKQRIYQRERAYSSLCDRGDYYPFLSLNFTSIAISKQVPSQQSLMVKDQNIEEYNLNKFICFNYLLIINKLMHSGSFSSVAAYHPRLPSIRESNLKILSQFLSPDAYSPTFKCSYCHLLTLKLRNPIKYAFFLADKGYIKVQGQVVDEDEDFIIVCLPFLRHNTRMFFGKGLKSANQMAKRCKKTIKNQPQKVSFSVRMFKKRLRGRMQSINLKQENTYGDFQLTFSWRDYLKGKIQHNINDSDELFDTSFYCLLQMEKELLFVFQVGASDFIQ